MNRASHSRKPTRWLIVDDAYNQADLLARVFMARKPDLSIETAYDGHHAIARLREAHFDMVLCDLQMPRLNGFELLQWLQAHQPHVDAVAMTAYPDEETLRQLEALGRVECYTKPLDVPRVLDRLIARLAQPAQARLREATVEVDESAPWASTADTGAFAVVDLASGEVRRATGECDGLQALARLTARVYALEAGLLDQLGPTQRIVELALAGEATWTLARPLPGEPGALAMLVLDPRRENVAFSRVHLDRFVRALGAGRAG